MEKDHLFETKPFLKTQCVLLVQVHLADNLLRTDRNVVLPAILFVKRPAPTVPAAACPVMMIRLFTSAFSAL